MPIRAAPFRHQTAACQAALETFGGVSRGYALLMEMGCGKSLTAIGIVGRLFLDGKIARVLVAAPLSILGVWEEEFAKFAGFDYTLAVLTGTLAKKTDALRQLAGKPLQVAVVNYESAWRLEKEIATWKPDLIICDEGHKLKNHATNASKAMHRLGARAAYRLLLTGTPVTNKAIDVFSQYKFLDPAIFGTRFYAWRNRYFDMVGYGQHTPVLKKSMESELARKMHSIAFRATKAECLDLPVTTDIIRAVELEASAMRTYRDLVRDSYAELAGGEITAANILTRLLRLSQLTGGFVGADGEKPERVSKAKLDALSDLIEEVTEGGRKLVVIARFVAEIAAIKVLCEKLKVGYAAVSGETKDRAGQVAAFQSDTDCQVFIGQIQTASLGLTLTASSTMAFYSLDYSMSNYLQAKARIHRAGQTQSCTYVHLTAKGTVDEKVLRALQDKADLARTLVDDCRMGRNPFT
jgi:SNF2 family DNA or RNA helicase